MKQKLTIILAIVLAITMCFACGCSNDNGTAANEYAKLPFPQHVDYVTDRFEPSDLTQDECDDKVVTFFREILLNDMIADTNAPDTKDEFQLVIRHSQEWEVEEGYVDVSHINVSESQGYGMMMMAYMAGSEDQLDLGEDEWIYGCTSLHEYYDAMLRTVQAYPSITGNRLFGWELVGYPKDGDNTDGFNEVDGVKTAPFSQLEDGDSATDGDMDIIYSLLLADKQWGSDGTYDYKQIALDMLEDLWDYCVHSEYHTLLLGDWAKAKEGEELGDATRPSDFILDHLKVYAEVDPDHDWQSVVDATYGVIKDIRDAEEAIGNMDGFLPDFVIRGDGVWEVPEGEVLEDEDGDGNYFYNSCRIPWRLGTDYLTFGNTDIGDRTLYDYCIEPLDRFAKYFTEGDLEILGPLLMNGELFDWDDPDCFAPEFLVTAVSVDDPDEDSSVIGSGQEWINTNWNSDILTSYEGDTYGDYIKMFCMLTASGNYWLPID